MISFFYIFFIRVIFKAWPTLYILTVILTVSKIIQLSLSQFIYTLKMFKWHRIYRKTGRKQVSLMEIVQCEHMAQHAAKAPPCQSSG